MKMQPLLNQVRRGTTRCSSSASAASVSGATKYPGTDSNRNGMLLMNRSALWIENTVTQRLPFSSSCLRTDRKTKTNQIISRESSLHHPIRGSPRQRQPQRQQQGGTVRNLTTSGKNDAPIMDEKELRDRLEIWQDLFVEARMCIEDARDSADTTYFDEEAEVAKESVDEAIAVFDGLVADLHDIQQKNSVLRSNGLKAEQLKGELQMVLTGGH